MAKNLKLLSNAELTDILNNMNISMTDRIAVSEEIKRRSDTKKTEADSQIVSDEARYGLLHNGESTTSDTRAIIESKNAERQAYQDKTVDDRLKEEAANSAYNKQKEQNQKNLDAAIAEKKASGYYGFSENQWNSLTPEEMNFVRTKAWESITDPNTARSQAYLLAKNEGKPNAFDELASSYNFKSLNPTDSITQKLTPLPRIIQYNRAIPKDNSSYSGCDITASITVGGDTFVIGNLSGLSYSVHRDKIPVRTLGRTYVKSYVSGGATIAGTLIFTVFDTHVLDQIRRKVVTEVQAAGANSSPLTQQLPPFDITVFFENEYGHSSYLRIYGVEISDEGQTHTINDIYTENQMQYVARDIDLMVAVDSPDSPQSLTFNNTSNVETLTAQLGGQINNKMKDYQMQITSLSSALATLNTDIRKQDDIINAAASTTEDINTAKAAKADDNIRFRMNKTSLDKIISKYENLLNTSSSPASTNLGSQYSEGRDNPYYLSRNSIPREPVLGPSPIIQGVPPLESSTDWKPPKTFDKDKADNEADPYDNSKGDKW